VNTDALCQLRSLWKTVFGDSDSFLDIFFDLAYSPDRCRYREEDGRIVTALYWFDCRYPGGKLAYIYAVATLPEYRGKGLASRLLEETHCHLKELGYAGAVLKPAKGLFPFYEKLGYRNSGYIRRFPAEAASVSAKIRRVSAQEYGRLRRKYLPENAVIQEGVTLEFLQSFAELYAAADALICALPQEQTVFEYLGDPHSAPGILAALGIPSAQIPTVGDEIPFTMFFPLNCTKIPGYLGISLE